MAPDFFVPFAIAAHHGTPRRTFCDLSAWHSQNTPGRFSKATAHGAPRRAFQ
jgi:hypothetical protein